MNVMNSVEMDVVTNVEQLSDFLFRVLPDGTHMFQQMDEIVLNLEEGIGGA